MWYKSICYTYTRALLLDTNTERTTRYVFVAPFHDQHVVAALLDDIIHFVYVTTSVFNAHFFTRTFWSHHAHKHHVITWKYKHNGINIMYIMFLPSKIVVRGENFTSAWILLSATKGMNVCVWMIFRHKTYNFLVENLFFPNVRADDNVYFIQQNDTIYACKSIKYTNVSTIQTYSAKRYCQYIFAMLLVAMPRARHLWFEGINVTIFMPRIF